MPPWSLIFVWLRSLEAIKVLLRVILLLLIAGPFFPLIRIGKVFLLYVYSETHDTLGAHFIRTVGHDAQARTYLGLR